MHSLALVQTQLLESPRGISASMTWPSSTLSSLSRTTGPNGRPRRRTVSMAGRPIGLSGQVNLVRPDIRHGLAVGAAGPIGRRPFRACHFRTSTRDSPMKEIDAASKL